jgi:hypothetical protein
MAQKPNVQASAAAAQDHTSRRRLQAVLGCVSTRLRLILAPLRKVSRPMQECLNDHLVG